jgi:hypothetical protein
MGLVERILILIAGYAPGYGGHAKVATLAPG